MKGVMLRSCQAETMKFQIFIAGAIVLIQTCASDVCCNIASIRIPIHPLAQTGSTIAVF